MTGFVPKGMGWQPDFPDARDYTFRHPEVLPLLRRLKPRRRKTMPAEVDLRRDSEGEYFTEPDDQGPLEASSAFAVLNLVEYFERRARGRTFEGSKQFLYNVTRNRLRLLGDTGADLRTTLKVLIQFGVPPEEHWPYDVDKFDEEPSAFLYDLAKPFSRLRYFRLGATYHINVNLAPNDGKKYPVVVFVHGNFGLGTPFGDQIHSFAKKLADRGYNTAVPHYYQDEHPLLKKVEIDMSRFSQKTMR